MAAAEVVNAVAIELRLEEPGPGELKPPAFSAGPPMSDPSVFPYPFTIPGGGRANPRTLLLGWIDGRSEIDRDTEIAVEIFCDYLGEAMDATEVTLRSSSSSPRVAPRT